MHANITDFNAKKERTLQTVWIKQGRGKEIESNICLSWLISISDAACWWFTSCFLKLSVCIPFVDLTEQRETAKTINKVRIDSVMDDMNRLIRRCLKAIHSFYLFFLSFLLSCYYFVLSFYRIFALLHFILACFCLFSQHIEHIISQNHAYCIKMKRVSEISMRLSWSEGANTHSCRKKNDEKLSVFRDLLLHLLMFHGASVENCMKLFWCCWFSLFFCLITRYEIHMCAIERVSKICFALGVLSLGTIQHSSLVRVVLFVILSVCLFVYMFQYRRIKKTRLYELWRYCYVAKSFRVNS